MSHGGMAVMYQSPVRRTAQSALHVMNVIVILYRHVYFMSVNATFAVAARTRKVSRRLSTCPTTGNILIMHKTLPAVYNHDIPVHFFQACSFYNVVYEVLITPESTPHGIQVIATQPAWKQGCS